MSRNSLTVFYGPKQVTDNHTLNAIADAIDNRKDYRVTNSSMGGDTLVGTEKFAMVYYRLDARNSPVIRGRVAAEGDTLKFGTDISKIEYAPPATTITNSGVYFTAYRKFISNSPFTVNNNSMGGDINPGVPKHGTFTYYKNGGRVVSERANEGHNIDWNSI
ncbi:hypothetical protein H2198_007314 [Neophaeococcomyces mojaviensis]|uniref:Uncharacterized protein n=1 Tax=Neophaeococcomyces mojaviensis TaxID=3383035 RepID=A0ACC3A0W6_9EURO|nr:hypothetical protein H2198_007314 [Knufia sp. JES_112]